MELAKDSRRPRLELADARRPHGNILSVNLDLVGLRFNLAVDEVEAARFFVEFPEPIRGFAGEVVDLQVAVEIRLHVLEPREVDVANVDSDFFHVSPPQEAACEP